MFCKYTFTKWNKSAFFPTGNVCFPCISYLLFIFLNNILYATHFYAYNFLLQQVLADTCTKISLILLKSIQSEVSKLLLSIKQMKNEDEFAPFLNFFFLSFAITMLALYNRHMWMSHLGNWFRGCFSIGGPVVSVQTKLRLKQSLLLILLKMNKFYLCFRNHLSGAESAKPHCSLREAQGWGNNSPFSLLAKISDSVCFASTCEWQSPESVNILVV